jgi:hypothetical protein
MKRIPDSSIADGLPEAMTNTTEGDAHASAYSPSSCSRARSTIGRAMLLVLVFGLLGSACGPPPTSSSAGDDLPNARAAQTPQRRGAPIYEGCFVRFDRATPTPAREPTDPGRLTIELLLDPQSKGGFDALELSLLDCAGAGHGPVRDLGWRRLALDATWRSQSLRLGADSIAREAASGSLAPAAYQRVFVAVDSAVGITGTGERVELNAHVEPITRPFQLAPGGSEIVRIVLSIQPRPAFMGGGWNLFVREARLAPSR